MLVHVHLEDGRQATFSPASIFMVEEAPRTKIKSVDDKLCLSRMYCHEFLDAPFRLATPYIDVASQWQTALEITAEIDPTDRIQLVEDQANENSL